MAHSPPVEAIINRLAPKYDIDPVAARVVAMGEGGLHNRENDIGDLAGGGSYGPFQLYAKGALPSQYRGNARAADSWAWSPAGIEYALRKMQESGASGLRGASAVEAIIRKFERPADPDGSVAKALARLGAAPTMARGSSSALSGVAAAAPTSPSLTPAIAALLDSNNQILGTPSTFSAFASLAQQAEAQPALTAPPKPAAAPRIKGTGVKFLTQFAAPYGLTVTSTTGGKHVKDSYHYRGKAVDFGGEPGRLGALAEAALRNPGQFAEMFYTGPGNPGFYIKNGQVYPMEQLSKSVRDGHQTHVHIATR